MPKFIIDCWTQVMTERFRMFVRFALSHFLCSRFGRSCGNFFHVSAILYICCNKFPQISGIANSRIFPVILPFVKSLVFKMRSCIQNCVLHPAYYRITYCSCQQKDLKIKKKAQNGQNPHEFCPSEYILTLILFPESGIPSLKAGFPVQRPASAAFHPVDTFLYRSLLLPHEE